jgi:UDP-2,3-diacylglucosamine pyrophosphatase LpxH
MVITLPYPTDLDNRRIYVVSDLHMGDGSGSDNFFPHRQRFLDFLSMVEKDTNASFIMAGDTFDFWEASHGDIARVYFDLIKKLIAMKTLFLVGNHDIDLLGFIGLPINIPIISMLSVDIQFNRSGRHFRICHGQEFDSFNDPSKSIFVGRMVAMLMGEYEKKYGQDVGQTNVQAFLEQFIEPVTRKIILLFSKMYVFLFGRTSSKKGDKVSRGIKESLDEYRSNHLGEMLVMGHTHRYGWYGDWCVNTGMWWDSPATYVKIEPNGETTLHEWPSQKVLTNQCVFKS